MEYSPKLVVTIPSDPTIEFLGTPEQAYFEQFVGDAPDYLFGVIDVRFTVEQLEEFRRLCHSLNS